MKEHPILFNAEMVRAILDGRKTQTRRPVKPQTKHGVGQCHYSSTGFASARDFGGCSCAPVRPPFGQPGDLLWVRETWCGGQHGSAHQYRADWHGNDFIRWRPSPTMPKEAARIWLRVKRVWVERVQDISAGDVVREGVAPVRMLPYGRGVAAEQDHRATVVTPAFRALWDTIYATKDLGWERNPWVWCCEFERAEGEGAQS